MATYEYRVATSSDRGVTWKEVEHDRRWMHEAAIAYCRIALPEVAEPLTAAKIERRRGRGAWQLHRLYVVGVDGITRRIDDKEAP